MFIKKKKGGRIRVRKKERQHCGDKEQAQGGELPCPALAWGPDWGGGGSVRREEGLCPAFGGGSDRTEA